MAFIVAKEELEGIRADLGLADYYGRRSNSKADREMANGWASHAFQQVDSILKRPDQDQLSVLEHAY